MMNLYGNNYEMNSGRICFKGSPIGIPYKDIEFFAESLEDQARSLTYV